MMNRRIVWKTASILALALLAVAPGTGRAQAVRSAPSETGGPIEGTGGPIEPIGPAPPDVGLTTPNGSGTWGKISAPDGSGALDAATIRTGLRKQGYYDIHGLSRHGNRYETTATKDGRVVEIEIDARSGVVKEKGS